jgi:prolyl-tRNA synthetase
MRQSSHIGKILKEDPKDAQTVGHKLLVRAGYMRPVSPGVYVYMPFLLRTLHKISRIIREEMNAIGCEELLMPSLQPMDLWVESGRWEREAGVEGNMFTLKDRRGSTVCLGLGHEEVITDMVRKEVSSYKQLPKKLYQIQTKLRDEPRPRFGLLRAREFLMMDAYSFDVDEVGFSASYQIMEEAYQTICKRIGLRVRCVEADVRAMGESDCHDFMALAEVGDILVLCGTCDYAATQERAESRLEVYPQDREQKPMEAVYGPGLIGVEPLADFLAIPVWKTTKTLLYQADDKLVAVMVRGDCDVNEAKVKQFLNCNEIALATPETIRELTGAEVGYAGPVGLPPQVTILADHYTRDRVNFECGANKSDYHNINVNFGRDLPLPVFGDFKLAQRGHLCPRCERGKLEEACGIEIGHGAKLGTQYSAKMNCTYLNKEGKSHPMVMGYGSICVSKAAAAVIEQNHDDSGIIWPIPIAPFQVHLIALNTENEEVSREAEKLYRQLKDDHVDVLFDDRNLPAGEKFFDADLLGIPIRLTVSKRTCREGKLELKLRNKAESELLIYDEILKTIKTLCG